MPIDAKLAKLEGRFDRRRPKLLRTDAGRWALVVDGTRASEIEIFDSQREALDAGAQHPSRRRFCVRHIVEVDEVVSAALGPRTVGAVLPGHGRNGEAPSSGGFR